MKLPHKKPKGKPKQRFMAKIKKGFKNQEKPKEEELQTRLFLNVSL